jgi:PAS domain S-box-containing protein
MSCGGVKASRWCSGIRQTKSSRLSTPGLAGSIRTIARPLRLESGAAIDSGGHFWSDEYRYRRSNGSYALVTNHGFLLRDNQGTPLRMIGAMSDIRSQREAEKRIHLQSNLLDAVGQAVIATRLDGAIIYWNRFAETLYGWSAQEVIGRNLLEVTPTQATKEQAAEILSRIKAGETWSVEFLVQRRDGTVFPAMVTTSEFLQALVSAGRVRMPWQLLPESWLVPMPNWSALPASPHMTCRSRCA